jgi:hypothetical protein
VPIRNLQVVAAVLSTVVHHHHNNICILSVVFLSNRKSLQLMLDTMRVTHRSCVGAASPPALHYFRPICFPVTPLQLSMLMSAPPRTSGYDFVKRSGFGYRFHKFITLFWVYLFCVIFFEIRSLLTGGTFCITLFKIHRLKLFTILQTG